MSLKAFNLAAVALVLSLVPAFAAAGPITLKLSFFTSNRSNIYQCQIGPFVDAVNADGAGMVQIKVYFSGTISPVLADQPKLVLDGTADLAIAVPGNSPQRFPDSAVFELPGLFRDEREASRIFTRLVEAGALKGFKPFFVVGAFVSDGESIHSRKQIATIADLKGQKIRVNNEIEAKSLRKLGAIPVLLPLNKTMDALGEGKIDGATVAPAMVFEFGFGRLTSHHYLLHLGAVPTALVMNRKKLESLPKPAQALIRKYSGEWLSSRASACFATKNRELAEKLKADRRRTVVEPSPADLAAARSVFASVTEEWAAQSPHNRELLELVRAEIAKLRSSKEMRP